jgi:uncharacterized protein (TIGR03435 family)
MMRKQVFATALLLGLLSSSVFAQPGTQSSTQPASRSATAAQSSTAQPAFIAADIHPSPYSFQSTFFRTNTQGTDRYLMHQATLLDMISIAYKVDQSHVLGGPTWLDFDHFEVIARQPPSTPLDTSRLMLRTLLADRFSLVVHNDMRPMPARILTIDKLTGKMKPAADTAVPSQCQYQQPSTPPGPDTPPPVTYNFSCRNITMEQYAEQIPRFGPTESYSIVDRTGLKGAWDFDISYTMLPSRTGLDLENDLEKQLGLKLANGDTPQPVVIVDSAHQTPTPNSPKLAELLPPPVPPAFDVAVIQPSKPDMREISIRFNRSGQVNITGATIQALISEAYDISGAMIADIPDFLSKDRWDIVAKVDPTAFPKGPNGAPLVSYDDTKLMLRALLQDRFGMKAHFEDRPADAYVLSSANPKLKKTGDPNGRTSCDSRPPPGEKDPRAADPIRERLMVCKNITVTQFAGQLEFFALDYIKSPVLDATHIEGSYDITLNWSRSRVARGVEGIGGQTVRNPDTGANAGNGSLASEPTGAISLPDAISKQLGLKLEMQKRPVPLLVLDHIEKQPSEN